MSFEKAKADLEEKGLGDHVIVLNESSATVAEAAHALGVEPASIAKTLSVLQGEKPVLIVTEGTAKLDNHKLQVEVLANLDKVQPAGAVVIVSYPRIEGATGLPARVWAITE